MPNGKVLWLCDQHESCSLTHTEEKYKDQLKQNAGPQESADFSDDDSGKMYDKIVFCDCVRHN